MAIPASLWPELSRLLDEALNLAPADRATWLDRLSVRRAELAPHLQRLLAAHQQAAGAVDPLSGPPSGLIASALAQASGQSQSALQAGQQLGAYRLIQPIGHGGMASVWLAEQTLNVLRRVALKLPYADLEDAPATNARFKQERDFLAGLEHEHVARLYDAGVTERGQPYLAMEWIDGLPITRFADERQLTIAQRLQLFLQVLQAVSYAHARLVIHRDIKPSNILVTPEGQVKLLDFGIARLLGDGLPDEADAAARALTPDSASPEQLAGQPLGTASDVYSLGVLLYELMTGQRPYSLASRAKAIDTAALHATLLAITLVEPSTAAIDDAAAAARGTRPRRLRRALAGDLDAIVGMALMKQPAQRYPSVDAMAQDLQRHVDCLPVGARHGGPGYRASRFVMRHRIPVAAAAAIAAALISGATLASLQAREAHRQATQAQAEAHSLGALGNFMLGTFSRLAADPALARNGAHGAMASALKTEVEKAEAENQGDAKSLGEIYGNLAAMFNFLDDFEQSQKFALKELQQMRLAVEPAEKIAEAERQIALAYSRQGQYDEALAHLAAGRQTLANDPDAGARILRARLFRATGRALESMGESEQALDAQESALRELRPDLRTQLYYATTLTESARSLTLLGQSALALQRLNEARSLFAAMPQVQESDRGDLEWAQAFVFQSLGQHASAEAAWRKTAALYAKQFGTDSANAAGIDTYLASALSEQGRYADARNLIAHAVGVLLQPGKSQSPNLIERAVQVQARIQLQSGDLSAAQIAVDELAAHSRVSAASQFGRALLQARLASARGLHGPARAALAQARALAVDAWPPHHRNHLGVALAAAEIELAAGQPEAVRELLRGWPLPETDSADWTLLLAADLRAQADAAAGQVDAALAWYQSPTARLGGGQATQRGPRDEALARLAFGRALRAKGQREAERAQYEQAAPLIATQHALSPLRAAYLAATRP
jgi:hypothetical protein